MIKLDKVTKYYYGKGVVSTGFKKVSLDLNLGEFVVVVGESGSGKSTLLNVISGLDSYEEGEMYVNGRETSHFGEDDRNEYRKKYVANIFQSFNLINAYTVKQNIELALILCGYKKRDIKPKVEKVLRSVGLWKYRNRRVTKLSGGQKQRVAIARALVQETPIIVCDEPTGNLDSRGAKEIFKLLHEVASDKLVVVITHNFEQVSEYATRVIKMHDGEVIEDKKVKEAESVEISYDKVEKSKTRLLSRINLALKNAFSTYIRFFLCTAIFVLISFISLFEISSFDRDALDEAYMSISYQYLYNDLTRIVVNKKDKSAFTTEEINNLKNIPYVSNVDINDTNKDLKIDLTSSQGYFLQGIVSDINEVKYTNKDLTYGRLPQNENEVLYVTGPEDYEIQYNAESKINVNCNIENSLLIDKDNYIITGIVVDETYSRSNSGYGTLYFYGNKLNDIFNYYTDYVYTLGKIESNLLYDTLYEVQISDKVNPGEVYVFEEINSHFKDNKALNKTISLDYSNIYFKNSKNFKITKVYDEKTFNKIFNKKDYFYPTIIINPADYLELSKQNEIYQIGIYATDKKYVDDIVENIDSDIYRYVPLVNSIGDFSSDYYIIKFISYCILAIIIVVLFFIANLTIYLILKSRSSYYAVIRMLGGTKKDNRSLVYLELLTYATVGGLISIVGAILIRNKVILKSLYSQFILLNVPQYILVFGILIVMSLFISLRFTKKIFKESMISTYNMEV